MHGGKSTGPRTLEGKVAAASAPSTHGGHVKLSVFQRMLSAHGDFMEMPKSTNLEDEIRFARFKFAMLPIDAPSSAHTDLLDLIRRLTTAQQEMHPGADAAGDFRLEIRVVGQAPPEAVEAEGG